MSNKLLNFLFVSSSVLNDIKYGDARQRKKAAEKIFLDLCLAVIIGVLAVSFCAQCIMLRQEKLIVPCNALFIVGYFLIIIFLDLEDTIYCFKDYSFFAPLPLKMRQVLLAKFIYLYIKKLPIIGLVSIVFEIAYALCQKLTVLGGLLWILSVLLLELLALSLAIILSTFITRISMRFGHFRIIRTILILCLVVLLCTARFAYSDSFTGDNLDRLLEGFGKNIDKVTEVLFFIRWFTYASTQADLLSFFLLLALSAAAGGAAIWLVGCSYKKYSTRFSSISLNGKVNKKIKIRKKSIINSLADNEFRRLFKSGNYLINMTLGLVFTLVFAAAVFFMDLNTIMEKIEDLLPIQGGNLIMALLFVNFLMTGMTIPVAASVSLDGKCMWILQTLPISRRQYCISRIRFNFTLQFPALLVSCFLIGLKLKLNMGSLLLYFILALCFCVFSSVSSLFFGIKFIKLDWKSDLEVIKQGAAVGISMGVNALIGMLFLVIAIAVNVALYIKLLLYIALLLALSYMFVKLLKRTDFLLRS